jgi:HK97 family phage prohead protease
MLFKTCPATVKAAGENDGLVDGQFEAIVSVFGNKDSYGDIVRPGAFAETLAEWEASGDPIPVYYSHRMDDPDFNIGHVLEAKETDEGLWVKAQIDLEDDAPSKARQVYRLMKGRRLTQFSFAYDVVDGGYEKDGDEEFFELRKVRLYEVGPTPIGANQETELLGVKAAAERLAHNAQADLKAGRVLSAKNEATLREAKASLDAAAQQITDVLSVLDREANDDQEKASATGPAKDEEPARAKSEEPTRGASVDVLAAEIDLLSIEGAL